MNDQLDTYTYAMSKGVQFSTGTRGIEWIGPCPVPGCSSRHDAFSVQPEGKSTGRWAEYGAWMCRKCWDPSETVTVEHGPDRGMQRKRGWGTLADLVMACEGMTYGEAHQFILAYEGVIVPLASRPALQKPKTDEVWFAESIEYLAGIQRTDAYGRELVANYLASRGLTVETAQRLGLGYSVDTIRLKDGTFLKAPFLVIPWYKNKEEGTLYRTINRRYLTLLPGNNDKYRVRAGSTKDALYLGECLRTAKRPTFLVESELDAATILQEAGDLVNVCATGSVDGGRNAVNEVRLRRQPFVFISFDTDAAGEGASEHWFNQLDGTKRMRYRPLMHDANEMHTTPGLSVRQWVEAGLAAYYVSPSEHIVAPSQQPTPLQGDVEHLTFLVAGDTRQLQPDEVIQIAITLTQLGITFSETGSFVAPIGSFPLATYPKPTKDHVLSFVLKYEPILLDWVRGGAK